MTLRCTRCDQRLPEKSLLVKLGLGNARGYECNQCGTPICESCYRERQRELGPANYDGCPVCDGLFRHR